MTKETMIYQTLSWIIAGMVANKRLPATKELFEQRVIADAMTVIDYPESDIKQVFQTTDVTQFSRILSGLYKDLK